MLIAVTDRLKGSGEALVAVFPATTLQTCITHLMRNGLDSWERLAAARSEREACKTIVGLLTLAAEGALTHQICYRS